MNTEQDARDDSEERRQPLVLRRETPAVLASFKPLIRGNQQLHTRLLQYSRSEPTFDIREYVRTPEASYFTRKGIALTRDQCALLMDILPEVIERMNTLNPRTEEKVP